MKKIACIIIAACVIVACNKDKFKTQPQMEITSYNTKVLPPGQDQYLIIQLKFTDKEGDISNGKFIYVPNRLNIRPVPPDLQYLPDSSSVPTFPDQTSGTFEFKLPWNVLHKSDLENDTLYFSFVAEDRAGNKSDSVRSDNIVILRQ